MFKKIISFSLGLLALNYALADTCQTMYKPHANEKAYALVGQEMKVSYQRCHREIIKIHKNLTIKAVNLEAGLYDAISSDDKHIYFSTQGHHGSKISTCSFCDGLRNFFINTDDRRLCVTSVLGVKSCAKAREVPYTIHQQTYVEEDKCTPSLVYYGISGQTLRFAVNDCKTISEPVLTYDLRYGRKIRFLSDYIEIIAADNEGISYKRIGNN